MRKDVIVTLLALFLLPVASYAQVVGGGPVIGGGGSGGTGLPGANEVTESMLKVVNACTDEYVLTCETTTGDFEWQVAATGDVVGPASATANAIARFDSTTGKLLKNSAATITDTGTLAATVSSGIQALIVGRSAGATLEVYPGTTDVQVGTIGSHPLGFYVANGSPSLSLPVGGGIDIPDKGTRPTCDSAARGTFWVDEGGAGVADSVAVCTKDAADAYDWRPLF